MDNNTKQQKESQILPSHSLKPHIERYLSFLTAERNLSLASVNNYRRQLAVFLSFDPPAKPENITEDVVRKYKVFLRNNPGRRGNPRSVSTVNVYLTSLRGFLRYLAAQENRNVLASDRIELLQTGDREMKVLTDEQLESFLACPLSSKKPQAVRDHAILELLFSTGMRVSELTSLNRDDINLKTKEISVLGKRQKVRVVFVTKKSAQALKKYLDRRVDSYPPLFIRTKGPKDSAITDDGESLRLSSRSIWNIVHEYALKANIVADPSPHTIRHTLATSLLRRGADLRAVQEILGHKDVSTTQIYTHVTNPELKKIHQKYHPRNE